MSELSALFSFLPRLPKLGPSVPHDYLGGDVLLSSAATLTAPISGPWVKKEVGARAIAFAQVETYPERNFSPTITHSQSTAR